MNPWIGCAKQSPGCAGGAASQRLGTLPGDVLAGVIGTTTRSGELLRAD